MPGTDRRSELIGHLLDSLTTAEKVAVGFLIIAAFGLGVWLGTWVTERRIDNAVFDSKQQIHELKSEVQRLQVASGPLKGTGNAAPTLDDAAAKPDMSRYANGVLAALCIVVLGLIATWLAVSRQRVKFTDLVVEPQRSAKEADLESMHVEALSFEDYLAHRNAYKETHADKTELQQRAFYQIYSGKRYQFTGSVDDVSPMGGSGTLLRLNRIGSANPVAQLADCISCDCGPEQRVALHALEVGQQCTVTGIMTDSGMLDGCRLVTA